MHSNLWATLYLTIVPIVLCLLISLTLKLLKRRYSKTFLIIGIVLLIFPVSFLFGHFYSVNSEMNLRAGTYIVMKQENIDYLCADTRFDTLELTLKDDGDFFFNYKPCFTSKLNGKWEWYENMVSSGIIFDKLNDSLYLYFPNDNIDTIVLTKHQMTYLTFSKR